METAKTEVDLKWKLNKFINSGDVSFLGHSVKRLNNRISLAESKGIVDSADSIVSITKSPCETAQKLNVKKNSYKGDA
jgi:hypothetical protein